MEELDSQKPRCLTQTCPELPISKLLSYCFHFIQNRLAGRGIIFKGRNLQIEHVAAIRNAIRNIDKLSDGAIQSSGVSKIPKRLVGGELSFVIFPIDTWQ